MEQDINLKIKLSRVYKIKKKLVQELNALRKELSTAVKNTYVSETVPESVEFAMLFRDNEYIKLNKFLTQQINLLEKPLSGDTQELFETEIENVEKVLSETAEILMETVAKINRYIQNLTGGTEDIPLEQYIARIRQKLMKNVEKELKKEILPDIQKLKEKLEYIYKYENYSRIMDFLLSYEKEVNLYLNQKGIDKLSSIFKRYKENLSEEISEYMKKYIKSNETRKKVISEINKILEDIDINRNAIHYTFPDIKKHFSGFNNQMGKMDIIMLNLESKRFIAILLTGFLIFIGGLFLPLPEEIKRIAVLLGFTIGAYSFVDAAFFNKYYLKKFVKEVRESIKRDVEKSTDRLMDVMIDRIYKSALKAENLIISLIKRETRIVKEFENYLVNLRNNIERHIFIISNIKKELDYELSEED